MKKLCLVTNIGDTCLRLLIDICILLLIYVCSYISATLLRRN